MRLYPKSLNSLEALKREKIRLRYERMHTRVSDLNPLDDIGSTRRRKKVSASAKSGIMSTIMELAGAKSNLQLALALGKPLLRLFRRRRAEHRGDYLAWQPRRKSPSLVKKVLADIAVSYLMGKALQMSIKGFQLYFRRRKAQRLARKIVRKAR